MLVRSTSPQIHLMSSDLAVKRKRLCDVIKGSAKRLCTTPDSKEAVKEALLMMVSLQQLIVEQDDTIFWISAAVGTKGRYGTVVGWVSTAETKEREAWIQKRFENPWSEDCLATFGTCPKSQFLTRDWTHDIYTPNGHPDLVLIDQLAPIKDLKKSIRASSANCPSDYDPQWLASLFRPPIA